MSADPTPPTPRAVLVALCQEAMAFVQGSSAQYVGWRPRELLSVLGDQEFMAVAERDYLAALAASAGPLSAEALQVWPLESPTERGACRSCHWVDGKHQEWCPVPQLTEYRTAYTALAADLTALRATVAEYEAATNDLRKGDGMYYATQERAMAPGIVDSWPAVIAHPTNVNGRLVRKQFHVATLARTPTPEGQG